MLSIADVISTVEFDSTGNYLATGDKGGRVVLFERNEQVRYPHFLCLFALPRTDWIQSLNQFPPSLISCRRRTASTSFTRSSNHMSPSLIISSRSRSRRRLTRSSGANGRMLLTFCCPLTVRAPASLLRHFPGEIDRIAYLGSFPRQDHQTVESFRKIPPCCVRVQPLGWPKKLTNTAIPSTSPASEDDAAR